MAKRSGYRGMYRGYRVTIDGAGREWSVIIEGPSQQVVQTFGDDCFETKTDARQAAKRWIDGRANAIR